MHPILQELKKDFGLEGVEVEEIDIGGHSWTLRPVDPSDYDWATSLSTRGAVSDPSAIAQQMMGKALQIERALASVSVAAIDGTPTWEVFEVLAPERVRFRDVLRPPARIRHAAAEKLMSFLSEDTNMELSQALSAAYTAKIEPKLRLMKKEMDQAEAEGESPLV